jgi:hypothetical protein
MTRIHVEPATGKWAVRREDDDRVLAEFDEHEQAEQFARDAARREYEATESSCTPGAGTSATCRLPAARRQSWRTRSASGAAA